MTRTLIGLALVVMVVGRAEVSTGDDSPDAKSEQFFELKVRPVLAGTCVKCHGESKASGGLRVDSREALLTGGDSGPAIAPGDPQGSLLITAIGHADDVLKMPPKAPLPPTVQADLKAWVAAGAPWPSAAEGPITGEAHWAFQPLDVIAVPDEGAEWSSHPIDRLIAVEQARHGVRPVARADRGALIRRASYDLIGLPPAPARVMAFVADDRPDAFARLIDELLASPQYGERWGRYWLDLARYADTAGDNSDYPIREAYLYRDYVIDAFNTDVPYDRFLHEQIAGDILAAEGPRDDYARRVIATGFLAQAKRFGTRKLEDIHQIIEDTLNTTGQTVLGLTLRCARCHDHKYDPISSRDYYALYGFFAGTKYPFAGAEEDHRPSEFAPLVPPDQAEKYEAQHVARLARLKSEYAAAETGGELTERVGALGFELAVAEFVNGSRADGGRAERMKEIVALRVDLSQAARQRDVRLRRLREEIKQVESAGPMAMAPVAYAVRDGEATDVPLQIGGDPRRLGEVVPRGVPAILGGGGTIEVPATGSGRLALARWLTEGPARGLVARVMVNRIWQHHFGKPIVATPSDFGLRGAAPSHPELLDWLAAEFLASGWSIKAMHRRIMLSETYQLASTTDSANAAVDTGNAWYWRFDRRPLDAEALRDTLLVLGGHLAPGRPGPHPFPDVETWRFTAHHQFKALYPSRHRSVYLMVQRLHPHPYLALFNGPDTSATTALRDDSMVSLQALYLLNNPFVHEQAQGLADRLLATDDGPAARLDRAYLATFGRLPSGPDRARAEEFLASYKRRLRVEGVPEERIDEDAWAGLARAMFASNEFIYVD